MIDTLEKFDNSIRTQDAFVSETFDLPSQRLKIFSFKSNWASFENCTFNCDTLEIRNIYNPKFVLIFKGCTFNCSVSFSNSSFDQLTINNTKFIKELDIKGGVITEDLFELNTFQFSNVNNEVPDLITNFCFSKLYVKKTFSFENIKHTSGRFEFINNKLGEVKSDRGDFTFFNSQLFNSFFSRNTFNELITFYLTDFKYDSEYLRFSGAGYKYTRFYKNTFVKSNFTRSKFIDKCEFRNCDFLSTTWFEDCKNLENTNLSFIACEFKGFVLFNNSTLNVLDIVRCTFDKSVSFTDAIFNTLKLFEVKFGGGAYFDEMKINKVTDKSYLKDKTKILDWKRTLRAIKQELQKTENKIDFNRFRAHELAAHYKELTWQQNFKDKFILCATKWSTDFGASWVIALKFTIISGFVWFSILYRIENTCSYNPDEINDFFVGFFRFFLSTDFYNPLKDDRTYLDSGWSWLIFIIGKIFIAFGIYEMIQSFRKFKA